MGLGVNDVVLGGTFLKGKVTDVYKPIYPEKSMSNKLNKTDNFYQLIAVLLAIAIGFIVELLFVLQW